MTSVMFFYLDSYSVHLSLIPYVAITELPNYTTESELLAG